MKPQDRTLRIIGGNWRGRKVTFANSADIRPTADRIRETLFNWLMHDIVGARCLDLYAGSGILSIEALSRGASHVTLVDSSSVAVNGIRASLTALGASEADFTIACEPAHAWLAAARAPVDIIFMDPPFDSESLYLDLGLIAASHLTPGIVYLESASPIDPASLPDNWTLHRHKTAGAVHFGICHCG